VRRRPLLIGLAASAVCLAGFWELAAGIAYSPAVARFDSAVTAAVQGWRAPMVTALMRVITAMGGTVFVTLVTVALVVMLLAGGRRFEAGFTAGAVGGGVLISTLAKGHFERPRPAAVQALVELPASYSFPSGHSMASLCLGTAIGWLAIRSGLSVRARVLVVAGCALYALAVGLTRVYLGVHYPSDVIASWLLGGAWLSLCIGVAEAVR